MQINAYQEGTKINTEVNKGPLKNVGTHWNIRHRLFQRVPISFSLYTDTSEHIRLFTVYFSVLHFLVFGSVRLIKMIYVSF